MASTYRRTRGQRTVQMHMRVAPDIKAAIDRYAALSGAPQWAIVEAAIRAGHPGADGIPVEWDLEMPDEPLPNMREGGSSMPRT